MKARTAMFLRFEQAGFSLVRCSNHAIWRCPCGHATVTTACTSGGGRGDRNALAQLQRTLNTCHQRMRECA